MLLSDIHLPTFLRVQMKIVPFQQISLGKTVPRVMWIVTRWHELSSVLVEKKSATSYTRARQIR